MTNVIKPNVTVTKDFDGYFESEVNKAINLNVANNVPMADNVIIDSGPYRPYDVSFEVENSDNGKSVFLDFYSASRVFGCDYSLEDLAEMISLEGVRGSIEDVELIEDKQDDY